MAHEYLYSIDFQFCNTKQNKKTNHDRDGTQLLGGHGKVSLSFCFVGKDKIPPVWPHGTQVKF
jgi:hypothetical protein